MKKKLVKLKIKTFAFIIPTESGHSFNGIQKQKTKWKNHSYCYGDEESKASEKRKEHTRATRSASTTGIPWDLKRLETVRFPDAIPPVNPTILIFTGDEMLLLLLSRIDVEHRQREKQIGALRISQYMIELEIYYISTWKDRRS